MVSYRLTTLCFGIGANYQVAFKCQEGEIGVTGVTFLKDSEKIKQELIDIFEFGVKEGIVHPEDLEYYKSDLVGVVSVK